MPIQLNSKKLLIGLFGAYWQIWALLLPHFWTKSAIIILSCASPRNHFSKIFSFIPLKPKKKTFKNGNHFKKNLQDWVPPQFLLACFCLKNSHLWNFCQEIITLTRTIRRGLKICHTNFTST